MYILCRHSFLKLVASKTVHYLCSQSSSIYFSLFCIASLIYLLFCFNLLFWSLWRFLLCCSRNLFSLCLSEISTSHSSNIDILCWVNFTTSFFDYPIILTIIVPSVSMHQVSQNFAHIVIIWSLIKFQISAVSQIQKEFFRISTA